MRPPNTPPEELSSGLPPASATARPDARLALDVDVLQHYIGTDAALEQEFLHEYRKSLNKHSEAMAGAVAEGDFRMIAMRAHTLKSSSRAAGATPLGDLLAALETAAQRVDLEGVASDYAAVRAEIRHVTRRLDELLGPSPR